jgi:hypothetical protein
MPDESNENVGFCEKIAVNICTWEKPLSVIIFRGEYPIIL